MDVCIFQVQVIMASAYFKCKSHYGVCIFKMQITIAPVIFQVQVTMESVYFTCK